jgi:hypothetical protein
MVRLAAQTVRPSTTVWPIWPFLLALWVLFLGPIIAPLFQATRLPFVADAGWLARDLLSHYVCPTPAKSYVLFDFPMAVCARCWGATIGLWLAWFAFRQPAAWFVAWVERYRQQPWWLRLVGSTLPFGLWVWEIVTWPTASYSVLLVNGALAGFAAGLFFCSIWPGLAPRPTQSSAVA